MQIIIDKKAGIDSYNNNASLLMKENKCRHIAVTDNGEIIGMLSIKDLERYYQQPWNM